MLTSILAIVLADLGQRVLRLRVTLIGVNESVHGSFLKRLSYVNVSPDSSLTAMVVQFQMFLAATGATNHIGL